MADFRRAFPSQHHSQNSLYCRSAVLPRLFWCLCWLKWLLSPVTFWTNEMDTDVSQREPVMEESETFMSLLSSRNQHLRLCAAPLPFHQQQHIGAKWTGWAGPPPIKAKWLPTKTLLYVSQDLSQGDSLLLMQLEKEFWIHKTYCILQSYSFSKKQFSWSEILSVTNLAQKEVFRSICFLWKRKKSTKELGNSVNNDRL